jgi:uncharacterized OB-fold protein
VSATGNQVPIKEGLYGGPAASPQLIGSRCNDCGEVAFPRQSSCPNCTGDSTEEVLLARRGKLWTWTIQRFPPPTPPFTGDSDAFVPFGVGYIELPEGIRVEARLTENDPQKLEIGMDMELVIEKFMDDEGGNERMTFAFRPVRP